MKVKDFVKKMGGASNATIRINEGFELVQEVSNYKYLSERELERTITFFNVFDNVLTIYTK